MIKPLYKYEQTKMTLDQTSMLMKAIQMENAGAEFKDEEAGRAYAILKGRIDHHNIACNKYVMLFICAISITPGELVLYAHALACISQLNGGREVGTTELCMSFARGFPNADEMNKAWADQKTEGNNLLDDDSTWTTEALKAVA